MICKKAAIIAAITAAALSAQAQNVVSRLSEPDSTNYATVTVIDHTGRLALVSGGAEISGSIRGHRVNIFVDNSQRARDAAQAAATRFSELFPDIPVHTTYNAPDWKVTVGNCITNEEAIVLWGRVKGAFDRAFITNEDIPLSALGLQQAVKIE